MIKEALKSFEDLECWKACKEVRGYVSEIVKKFPPEEKFALVNDMKRAARSTTHNIAGGYGRFHYQENIQFCRHSRGSLYEFLDQLITAFDEGYILHEELVKSRELIDKALALLNGYINYLSRAKNEHKTITR
ncbi:MAG: four helix bundle protein [Ignavibacteriae bacterium]|nr:four helix bundle protein [Ignavibacteriota bacterium]